MLCASLLLKHQEEKPTVPCPFRFAVFLSGWLPFSWTADLGYDVTNVLTSDNPINADAEAWRTAKPSSGLQRAALAHIADHVLFELNPEIWDKWKTTMEMAVKEGNEHLRPRCFHPDLYDGRLELATVHVWSERDIIGLHAKEAFRLCEPEMALLHTHDDGHDVPQSWDDTRILSDLIQKAVLKSQFAL